MLCYIIYIYIYFFCFIFFFFCFPRWFSSEGLATAHFLHVLLYPLVQRGGDGGGGGDGGDEGGDGGDGGGDDGGLLVLVDCGGAPGGQEVEAPPEELHQDGGDHHDEEDQGSPANSFTECPGKPPRLGVDVPGRYWNRYTGRWINHSGDGVSDSLPLNEFQFLRVAVLSVGQ